LCDIEKRNLAWIGNKNGEKRDIWFGKERVNRQGTEQSGTGNGGCVDVE
jgi:hypothetical protein